MIKCILTFSFENQTALEDPNKKELIPLEIKQTKSLQKCSVSRIQPQTSCTPQENFSRIFTSSNTRRHKFNNPHNTIR